MIPTKNVAQAFATLVTFDGDATAEENEANMVEALSTVKSGQVTYAVRDTVINDIEVKEGNIIGLAEGKLLSAKPIIFPSFTSISFITVSLTA